MKKKLVIGVICTAVIAGIGYYWYNNSHQSSKKSLPPVFVNAAEAKAQNWYTQIKATGTLSSFRGVMISSEVSGRVTAITFESGSFIKKDQPLFQIYPDILEAQLEQYKAMTKLAALDYARGLKLYQKNVISRQDLDQLTSTLEQDKALVAQTQAKLRQHNINAPFSGQAGLRLVNEGDFVSTGQNLVEFQQLSPLRVQFSIPENYLPLLAKQQQVQIVPSSNPKLIETGIVYAFDSAIDPNTRAISMRAEIPNKNHKLIPGGFAEVTLFAGQKREVVTVPQTAINYSTLGTSIYVIQPDHTVKSIAVTIGDRLGNDVEILSGLKAGSMVITAGQIKLYEGAKVIVSPTKLHGSQEGNTNQSSTNKKSAADAKIKSSNTIDDLSSVKASQTTDSRVATTTQDSGYNTQPSQE